MKCILADDDLLCRWQNDKPKEIITSQMAEWIGSVWEQSLFLQSIHAYFSRAEFPVYIIESPWADKREKKYSFAVWNRLIMITKLQIFSLCL